MKNIAIITAATTISLIPSTTAFTSLNQVVNEKQTFVSKGVELSSSVLFSEGNEYSRRAVLNSAGASIASSIIFGLPTFASADSSAPYLSDLEDSYKIIEKVPDLLRDQKWDEVRTLLKSPPVNYLWNMGDNQNTLMKVAKDTGNFDLIELKDELSISLQMCDQLTYDNVFVYFQPGSGKVKIKEPVDLAEKAIKQLGEAIDAVKSE